MKRKNLINKARHYVDNAKELLKEHGEPDPEIGYYKNSKCVKKAGFMLWKGVLMALDSVFQVRKDRRTRVDIDTYVKVISERDDKLSRIVDMGYNHMWVYMAYDGMHNKTLSDSSIEMAYDIINRCEKLLFIHNQPYE